MSHTPGAHDAPLVLLHGSGLDGRAFARLGGRLDRRGVRWVAPDFAFSRSPECEQLTLDHPAALEAVLPADLQRIRAAVTDLAASTGRPVRLFGHSYGGALALRLLSREVLPVEELILFEPAAVHVLEDSADPLWAEVSSLLGGRFTDLATFRAAPLGWVQAFVDYWTGPGAFASLPPPERERFAGVATTMFAEVLGLMGAPPRLHEYRRITTPVLLMDGERSPPAAHAIVRHVGAALPTVRTARLPGGHMSPVTHPDALLGVLLPE